MSHELQLVSGLPSLGSIESYCASVNALPLLSQEEEQELAIRFRDEGDLVAAQKLVLSQLRYVVRIAKGFMGYGLGFADLVQEGTVGLMKAVKRFDPTVGVRLVTFAVHWIKSEIHEFVIKNWRIVKVATTKAQRKLFFNLRRNKGRLGWFTQEEIASVAEDLGVSTKDVLEMEQRLSAHDATFDRTSSEDDDGVYAPSDYLESSDGCPSLLIGQAKQADDNQQKLVLALDQLDPRSKDIVMKRWLADKKTTLKKLAEEYGVSIERVRQIEQSAFEKMRALVEA